MNNLVGAFHFGEYDVRVWEEDGQVFAVGRDVAAALGYEEPHKAIQRHCKGGMKRPIPTAGGMQEMLVITEGDIFTLINKSGLPSAKQFQDWVNYEVLPTLRKTGSYLMPSQHDSALVVAISKEIGASVGKEIGRALADIKHETRTNTHEINLVKAELRGAKKEIGEIRNSIRKPFNKFDKACMVDVVKQRYAGYACPCCHKNKVLNDAGQKLSSAHYDHAMHRGKADRFHGWLVCSDCNNRFKTDRNDHDNAKFNSYLTNMNDLYPAKILAMPDKKPKQLEMI